MRLLALDTAGSGCSAGVFLDGRPLASRSSAGGIGHAERLPRLIEAVLAAAGTALPALGGLAVTTGPGSFSGIRTGLAAARGLALATGLGAVPVTTLEALAAPLVDADDAASPIAAIIDARRGQVFVQRFDRAGVPLDSPSALAPAAAAAAIAGEWRLVGNGAALVVPYLRCATVENRWTIMSEGSLDASGVALAAERALARGATPVVGTALRPCYARDADARPGAGRALLEIEA